MNERDLILMTLVIFVPSLAALPLCSRWIFPRGKEEWMRWWTLFATAVTLFLSLIITIDYYHNIVDRQDRGAREGHSQGSLLVSRSDRAQGDAYHTRPRDSQDWVSRVPWIDRFNIDYYLGIDGISVPLILLTTVISFLAMLASWPPRVQDKHHAEGHGDGHDTPHEKHWSERHTRGYCILLLILETGMIGTFIALDFFLFYVFWEIMLLPMYFLIGVWGGPNREYAAIKFFLYTLLGSVLILIALLGFYFTDVRDFVPGADPHKEKNSFDLMVLHRVGETASHYLAAEESKRPEVAQTLARRVLTHSEVSLLSREERLRWEKNDPDILDKVKKSVEPRVADAAKRLEDQIFFKPWFQITMFLLLLIGFAIKIPVFPFHTWLPDAHVEAPTPISMILAGVLLKMGGYGILRIAYPICPWAAESLAWWVALFGIINIVYGAFAAMAQTDFKKLVAYSSVSHMGYVLLGIAVWSAPAQSQYWSWGMNGAMFQMIAHGITSAGMFFLVGVIYDRAHHRNLDNFRGLYEPMPLYGGISAIIFFAAMGLPGMCGFVGEFMVILATWNYDKVFAILAALTVVLTASYILWTVQRVYFGTNQAYKSFPDITPRELLCVIPLVVLSVLLGILPSLLLNLTGMEPSITALVYSLARLPGW